MTVFFFSRQISHFIIKLQKILSEIPTWKLFLGSARVIFTRKISHYDHAWLPDSEMGTVETAV